MRFHLNTWLSLLFVLLLSACGGGGGGAAGLPPSPPAGNTDGGGAPTGDKITISVSTLSTGTTTTTYLGDLYDPLTTAQTNTVSNKTYVMLQGDYNLYSSQWDKQIVLKAGGTTPAIYSFTTSTAATGIIYYDVAKSYLATGGEITLTSVGAVGSRVKGTFTGSLVCITACTGTANISGSFDVTRIP